MKSKMIHIRVDDEIHEKIRQIAKKKKRTLSAYLRDIIKHLVQKQEG